MNLLSCDRQVLKDDKVELVDADKENEDEKLNEKIDEKDGESKIRNRKTTSTKENTSKTKPKKYNPINMFGVLVPLQLRKSQSHFQKTIPLFLKLVNLRQEILALETKLQINLSTKTKSDNDNNDTKI